MRQFKKYWFLEALSERKYTITNDYVFKEVAAHVQIAKVLIEVFLGLQVKEIKIVHKEDNQRGNIRGKEIRLDLRVVLVDNRVVNIEMQTTNNANFARRLRFYQSMVDRLLLQPGQDYSALPDSYTLVFCTFDPHLPLEQPVYQVQRSVYGVDGTLVAQDFGDGQKIVEVNLPAAAQDERIVGLQKAIVKYMANGEVDPNFSFVVEMDQLVTEVLSSEEWREEMTLLFPNEIKEFEKLIDRERAAKEAERAAKEAERAAKEAERAAKEAERLFGERKMDLVRVLDERGLMHELPAKGAADQVWLELMAKYQV